jgi:SAM-dependent methyltransferase
MFTAVRQIIHNMRPRPADEEVLSKEGHREFVGGLWDEMGQLQFDFLVKQGLRPNHVFLDVACGSLRAGRLLIPYLEPGNYLGIDKYAEVIEAGKAKEISPDLLQFRRPEFVVSDSFEFEKFSKRPDFCIAQSLFTHLRKPEIQGCFRKLAAFVKPGCRFFATYGEASIPIPQLASSHSVRSFFYTRRAMEAFGRQSGWESNYIGNWGHPRGQVMVEYVRR